MNVLLICSEANTIDQVASILLLEGLRMSVFHGIRASSEELTTASAQIMVIDLDSVNVETLNLRRLQRRLGRPLTLGISRKNYHPELREAVQSGIFTAIIKPPYEEELTYWINRLVDSSKYRDA